jgi:adenosylmethionine-8-amino-7-oxononanoate aminotransferase
MAKENKRPLVVEARARVNVNDVSREQLERWDQEHVWHPFTPMQAYMGEPPLLISHAYGCRLVDMDGNEYIDGSASLWCNVHGHRVPELDEALRRQLDQVAHSTLLGQGNIPSAVLARRLVEIAPPGLTRVFYSDSGAAAVEVALKMAFQYWRQCPTPQPNKTRYLSLNAAYHGDTLGAVAVGDLARFHHLFAPLLFPVHHAASPHCYRCPLGLRRESCGLACADEMVALIRRHADELAAVILEPGMQAAAGMIPLPEGYLRRVREVTRECSVLLIADEVAVGFGRTGRLFACDHEGVTPDFLCLAKGLTGGYLPLAATLTTDVVFQAFLRPEHTFYHGHTYTGNQLGCAVALASLDLLIARLPQLPARVEQMRQHLSRIGTLHSVGDIRQRGLMMGIELVRDRRTGERFAPELRTGARVCRAARAHGVLIRPLGDVVVVMPPLAIDEPTLDRLMEAVHRVIAEEC